MGTDGELISNHNEDFELNQYTGLKDHDKRDIYEGDIVEDGISGERGTVVFKDGSFRIACCRWEPDDDHIDDEIIEEGATRVIGNMYQNPELLRT
jgi:uncharacterized phage protein (TIGR01671 family)